MSLLKTLWEKEKLLVTGVFCPIGDFSAIFIKSKFAICKLFSVLEESKILLFGKGLTLAKWKYFGLDVTRWLKFVSWKVENIVGKGGNAGYQPLWLTWPQYAKGELLRWYYVCCTLCVVNNFFKHPKPRCQFEPNLAGMFLERSSLKFVHRIRIHQKLWLPWQANGFF